MVKKKSKSSRVLLIENAYYFSAPLFFEGIEDVITQSFDATKHSLCCHKPQVVKQYEKIHRQAGSSIYQLGLPADEEVKTSINSQCLESFLAAKMIIGSTNTVDEQECFYEKFLIMHALYDVTHQVKHSLVFELSQKTNDDRSEMRTNKVVTEQR